jgi:hypothetical protein
MPFTPKLGRAQDENQPADALSEPYAEWVYDPARQIMFVSHPLPVELKTRAHIQAYFDDGIRRFRERCPDGKAYVVVDYDNLTTNMDELEFYASQVKRVMDECAITIVRYKGSLLQRMASRMIAIKLHAPSNTYSSLEEAMEIVRGLQRGTISVQPPSG